MGVILYIWQKGGLCVQEPGIKPSVLFPQTMISRFNLVPCRHFHYLFLIENLFDSCFGKDQSICSHLCMINYTCRGIPSSFTSSVGRSYTSKSLDLFYFMDSKAASLICPLWWKSTDGLIPGSWTQRPPFCQIYRITPIKLISERWELQYVLQIWRIEQ
jgi:hypothetical protein